MTKFVQHFDDCLDYGGVTIIAFLNGNLYQLFVPNKLDGIGFDWVLAVDKDGEVYAYESTPYKDGDVWKTDNNSNFLLIGWFQDENSKQFVYEDWENSRQCVADTVYF